MPRLRSGSFARLNGLLASAVDRGVPLEPLVTLLAAQESHRPLKEALERAAQALHEGSALPEAFGQSPEVFPADYCALLEAGLRAGSLAEVLRATQTHYELLSRLARRMAALLAYLAVGGLGAAVAFAVILVATRQATAVYASVRVELPKLTMGLLWAARHPGILALGAAGLVGIGAGVLKLGRRAGGLGRLVYWIPLWGPIRRRHDLALMATTMALQIHSGRPAREALEAAREVVRNAYARRAIGRAAAWVDEGRSLSEALYYQRFFPRTLAWAVSLGEARGEVGSVLHEFASLYGAELERRFGVLLQLMSPLGVLFLGNVVLLAAAALFLPIVSLLQGFWRH